MVVVVAIAVVVAVAPSYPVLEMVEIFRATRCLWAIIWVEAVAVTSPPLFNHMVSNLQVAVMVKTTTIEEIITVIAVAWEVITMAEASTAANLLKTSLLKAKVAVIITVQVEVTSEDKIVGSANLTSEREVDTVMVKVEAMIETLAITVTIVAIMTNVKEVDMVAAIISITARWTVLIRFKTTTAKEALIPLTSLDKILATKYRFSARIAICASAMTKRVNKLVAAVVATMEEIAVAIAEATSPGRVVDLHLIPAIMPAAATTRVIINSNLRAQELRRKAETTLLVTTTKAVEQTV